MKNNTMSWLCFVYFEMRFFIILNGTILEYVKITFNFVTLKNFIIRRAQTNLNCVEVGGGVSSLLLLSS